MDEYLKQLEELKEIIDKHYYPQIRQGFDDAKYSKILKTVKSEVQKFIKNHEHDIDKDISYLLNHINNLKNTNEFSHRSDYTTKLVGFVESELNRPGEAYQNHLKDMILSCDAETPSKQKLELWKKNIDSDLHASPKLAREVSELKVEDVRSYDWAKRKEIENIENYELTVRTSEFEFALQNGPNVDLKSMVELIESKKLEFNYNGSKGGKEITKIELDDLVKDAKALGFVLVAKNIEGKGDSIEIKQNGESKGAFNVSFADDIVKTR